MDHEVVVDEDVLTAQANPIHEFAPAIPDLSGWRDSVLFLVTPTSASERHLSELMEMGEEAVRRFMLVTGPGIELPGAWALSDDHAPEGQVGPLRFGDGIVVGAVAESVIWPPQGTTMLRILLAELHSRKISARVSCPGGVHDRIRAMWRQENARRHESLPMREKSMKCWVVRRTVRCVTTTGVPYTDLDWLHPDGSWRRAKRDALSFEDGPGVREQMGELVGQLRAEAAADADPRHGSVTAVLTSMDDDYNREDLPPDSIRDHGHAWRVPPGL